MNLLLTKYTKRSYSVFIMKTIKAIGYIRVSTDEQTQSGLSLESQINTIKAEATRRCWDIEIVADQGESGSKVDRPGLLAAKDKLARGEAQALIVAKQDRLFRNALGCLEISRDSQRQGWSLICLDVQLDTSTPIGSFLFTQMAAVAELELNMIRKRTKDALAVKKAQGVRLGRPATMPEETRARINALRNSGVTLQGVADTLNTEGIPTARGGSKWYASTVQKAIAYA
jgi:DNA invertase Pin-like site-specific DNA recombinase